MALKIKVLAKLGSLVGAGLLFLSCAPTSSGSCNNITVLLPEAGTSARWDSQDRPLLVDGLKAALPGVTVTYANANGSAQKQQEQAEAALDKGSCLLILAAADTQAAADIVTQATTKGAQVIAYDRLIQSDDQAFYVSFDPKEVGQLQGEWIKTTRQPGDRLVMINGAETDSNAVQFREGVLSVLQPLIDQGELELIHDEYTPGWNNATAQATMETLLEQENRDIQIAYVANDGMASGVISALKANDLAGSIKVTGQDATLIGLKNIVLGFQGMTIYKPITQQADATIQLVTALINQEPVDTIATETIALPSGQEIPFVKLTPIVVTSNTIAETVLKEGVITQAELCQGLPPTPPVCP